MSLYVTVMRTGARPGVWGGVVVAGAGLLWTLATVAQAKSISIVMTPMPQLADGTLTVRLAIANKGDEAAQSVVPTLRFMDQEVRGKGRSSLGPNEALEETLTLPATHAGDGRWPYRVTVDYTDANQYPFQASHVSTVEVGSPPPAKVVVSEIQAPALSTSGSYQVKVKNLTATPRTAALAVVVPEGLEIPTPPPPVELAAWEEKTISGSIINRTTLAGSRYPVFVSVQYDDGAVHQTAVAQGIVEILAPRSFFAQRQQALWIGAGILVVLWIGFILWRRPGGTAARTHV